MSPLTGATTPTRLELLDADLRMKGDRLNYLYARVRKPDGRTVWRATKLYQLAFLPVEVREDPDLTGKMWAALRGMYDAKIPFTYTAAGIFTPEHVGLVQLYGGIGEGETEAEAARMSEVHADAVRGVLANYPQSRLVPPDSQVAEWIFTALSSMNAVLAIVGQPDPRNAPRGMGRKDSDFGGRQDNDITSQQNEILFRTLAKLRINYLFTVLAHPIERKRLANLLTAVAEEAAAWASLVHGSRSVSLSMGFPIIGSFMHGMSASTAGGHSLTQAVQDAWNKGATQTHTVQQSHTLAHGETRGVSVADSHGVALGRSHTESHGTGHTNSVVHTDSRGGSSGATETWSTAHTDGTSQQWAHSHSVGRAHTDSHSHADSQGVSDGIAHSSSRTSGASLGTTRQWSAGGSESQSQSHSHSMTTSAGVSGTEGESHSVNRGMTMGTNWSNGASDGHTSGHSEGGGVSSGGNVGAQLGIASTNIHAGSDAHVSADYHHTSSDSHSDFSSHGGSMSTSQGSTDGASSSTTTSVGLASSAGHSEGSSQSQNWSRGGGVSAGISQATTTGTANSRVVTHGSADTVGHADTHSVADTAGESHGVSHSDTVGHSTGVSHASNWGSADAKGHSDSMTAGMADGLSILRSRVHTTGASRTVSHSEAESRSVADSNGLSEGISHSQGVSDGDSVGKAITRSASAGWSAGIAPGVGISRSWMVENDNAAVLTELYRGIERLLYQASGEGGYLADALLFLPDEDAAREAAAAVPQAFHGPNVPQPVTTVPVLERSLVRILRNHALAFVPPPDDDDGDGPGFAGILGRRYGTLLALDQLAAYTSPSAMEEGIANTSQEAVPEFAFYPDMEGPCVVGVQFSRETGEFTKTPVRLSKGLFMHTIFAGDTGYGKTVAAMRYVKETTVSFHTKTVVLDFGSGWRDMLDAPGLQRRTRIYQFHPYGAFPLRWNPMQLGSNISPELQFRAMVDVFGAVTNLGEGRQLPVFRDAVRDAYLAAGVLVNDPDLEEHWRDLTREEEEIVRAAQKAYGMGSGDPRGKRLQDLEPWEKQAVAVYRSKQVDMSDVYARVQQTVNETRDSKMKEVLKGILYRLDPFVKGGAARLFRKGPDAVDVSEIVPDDWGLTVVEGGMFMDRAGKSFALAWLAWQIYTLAQIRFEDGDQDATWHLVFEEFNKIISSGAKNDENPGQQRTSEEYEHMFRDSRKYNVVLSAMSQTPSALPEGIRNSFINWFASRQKGMKDANAVLAAWAKSPMGLTDEKYRRWAGRMPKTYMTVMLGYSDDDRLEPFVMRAHMLRLPKVTNKDLWRMKVRGAARRSTAVRRRA